ncbi:predicted protein [Histoplasma capsulatum var. duboisii H88]|uniref:Predicted protein n=1 Tax=Ajellomyces capsulatus (strain H88) TaxID=544711 RepID=F0UR19_AJEC8|nr:predicted protein [Histoplasma capsulatum var. duboisii H88]
MENGNTFYLCLPDDDLHSRSSCIKPVDISSKSVETDIKEVHLSQAEMLESEQQISLILDPGKHILQTQELHQFNQPADVSMTGYSWLEIWPDWCHFQSLYGAAFYVIRISHGSPLTSCSGSYFLILASEQARHGAETEHPIPVSGDVIDVSWFEYQLHGRVGVVLVGS